MCYCKKLYAIGFLKHTVNWFKSYLLKRSFLFNLGNNFSQPASVSCDFGIAIVFNLCQWQWHATSCQMSSLSVCRWFMPGLST